ncbi:hypothetical protein A2863_01650 [Candidatus Woesebacteria bacterium RIFCSPHIGHO2_01_FULL_38_9b]|uniref:Phosphatidic acid phosphatase type 2/haloperoxidase domain-containing protein n=1 Tax=Candidatus Woesebacteria bacterium RIFCSPHIGHO2_01_FULL_38_9b TaxID=1802493 RepID=A0A1F7Y2B8_9BACT|nr:MAG: hypothetical protein A2863_01650 [Candidatus Woesebacteria bacterium RIFCSPHIGHO2_01_FULL_38_9b]
MNPAVLSSETSIMVTFLASFLIWIMFAGLIFMWVIDGRIKREQALHALLATLLSWVITMMIKSLLPSARPYIDNGTIPLTLTTPNAYSSFPSAHAAIAFAMATSLWVHNKKLGSKFIILAMLVSFGRILSNVHYLSDVFAGIVIGIASAFVTKRLHTFKAVG